MINCDVCNYKTPIAQNYEKHIKTIKHLNNFERCKSNICEYCDVKFIDNNLLVKHKEKCLVDKFNLLKEEKRQCELKLKEYEIKIEINEEKIEEQQTIIKESKKKIEAQEFSIKKLNIESNKYLKNIVDKSGNIIESSVSIANSSCNVMKHLMQYHNDAPLLKQISNNPMYVIMNDKCVNDLTYYYTHKQLDQYFGKFIIDDYKKDDTSKQSLWNTDGTRFNYIIRTLINDNPDWIIDKNAIQVCQYLIDPLLKLIKDDLTNYISVFHKKNLKIEDKDICIMNIKKIHILNDIITIINDSSLKISILKYITPFFHFEKKKVNKKKAIKNK